MNTSIIKKDDYLKLIDEYDSKMANLRPEKHEVFDKLIKVIEDSLLKFINSDIKNNDFIVKKFVNIYHIDYCECNKKIMQMEDLVSIQNKMKFMFIIENKSYIEWYLNNNLREMEIDHIFKYAVKHSMRQEPDEHNNFIMKKYHNVSVMLCII